MHRFLSLAIALTIAATAVMAQTSGTAICDSMAAQLQIVAGGQAGDPLALLSDSDRPYIELAGQTEMEVGPTDGIGDTRRAEIIDAFRARFAPTEELAAAWDDMLGSGSVELRSLPASDLRAIVATSGTAQCQSFRFFQTHSGSRSELLPELPRKSERDGDNAICYGFGSTGNLARVGGIEVFLESTWGLADHRYAYRVVPLEDGRWGSACTLEADFRTVYTVDRVFVPNDGPVTGADLTAVAPSIVERWTEDQESFDLGLPLTGREEESIWAMANVVAAIEDVSVPAFGAEEELAVTQRWIRDGDSHPLVLGGQAYLMHVGHPTIGWRVFSDTIIILYALGDGAPEPVATAILGQSQGPLESVRVVAGR